MAIQPMKVLAVPTGLSADGRIFDPEQFIIHAANRHGASVGKVFGQKSSTQRRPEPDIRKGR